MRSHHEPRHLKPGNPRKRTVTVLAVLVLLFGAILGRLFQLQLVAGGRYVALGDVQTVRSVDIPAYRGTVFDRNGHDLALSVPQQTVWADPRLVEDPQAVATNLAPVLGVSADELMFKLTTPNAHFVYLKRQVSDDVAEQVEELDLKGVELVEESRRFNPAGDMARSLLGSVDIDNRGIAGLELQYDDSLTGTPGRLVYEQDPTGRTIAAAGRRLEPALPGDDLILTIDQALQYEVEQALADQIERMYAKGGMAIVSNPTTGEIYAMVNLERPKEGGPPVPSANNKALTTVFEPGSAAKVITMAGALEEGVVGSHDIIHVPYELHVGDTDFKDSHTHDGEDMSLTTIMANSSNTGTILLGQRLGKDNIDHYQRAFGFGEKTALDFPNESSGIMLPPDQWSGTSIATIPMGQGISVTALQMLQSFNVIANGGVYVAPKLVQATVDEEGTRHPTAPSESHRVISTTTAEQVRDMMVAVVQAGTGVEASIDGYTVAGKTGTARKPLEEGGYIDGAGNYRYVATFAGFVPAENPQLSAIVVMDEPANSIFASGTSAPVFSRVAKYALRRLQIPPPALILTPSVPPAVPHEGAATAPIEDTNERVRQQPATTTTTTTTTTTLPPTTNPDGTPVTTSVPAAATGPPPTDPPGG